MQINNPEEYLYVEKYRPQNIEDCILPKALKETFGRIAESGEIPNMLLAGGAGSGKTTVAIALCKMLDLDYIVINASEDGNIDVLRTKIRQFASTVSFTGGVKVVILDEADYLNVQSTQPALRGFIEEFSNNCRFILTCNFKNRIIEPLHSRLQFYEFRMNKTEMKPLMGQFMKRLQFILDNEGITYSNDVLAQLIMKYAPDWRKVLGEVQKYGAGGTIDAGILVNLTDESVKTLVKYLKEKDFKKMRQWVVDNIDTDAAGIFRSLYDTMYDSMEPQSIPSAVLLLADYQYKNAFAADQELNVVACMTELMMEVSWK